MIPTKTSAGRAVTNDHSAFAEVVRPDPLRLDLGCGSNKRPGFWGVDSIDFPGVDEAADLRGPWPWADNSVTEVHASHFVEHLTATERVHFANELYRVLRPKKFVNGQCVEGFATIITPHWNSPRAYGDFTHQWPPVCEWWYLYLNREWRLGNPEKGVAPNAPHCDAGHNPAGYSCDFDYTIGVSYAPELLARNEEFKQFATRWYKDSCSDTIGTIFANKG